ncbi:MAG: BMP family ABC transporter substrate-binding protein [Treponema sp.]|jgi:simple sugar transport system substrate-binding protein|nr:BMP family ABC transporter substrate-binding protein [Treponema sp.]
MERRFFVVSFLVLIFCTVLPLNGGAKSEARSGGVSIAVFIPGVMAGSPIYEMLAQGVEKAAGEFAAAGNAPAPELTVIEGRFNQAEWEPQVTTLAASGGYDLIVSSNPSLPAIVSSVSAKFPAQKFLLLDGELAGNPSVYTLRYNQREQAYMAGHIAALCAREMAGERKRLGLLAAQEYPAMNNIILPGYAEGARAVDSGFAVDFRVVGNWFDAARGAELAAEMIRDGAGVILPVAGGAGEGAVRAAGEGGAKIVWFDTNGYGVSPGTVVGSAVLHQDKAAYEKTMLFLKGALPFGRAETAGIRDGYVDFIEDDPNYIASVSQEIRERQTAMIARLRSGALRLDD